MPRAVRFETYAPVLLGDGNFIPSVNVLVRDHLDKVNSKVVVTRTTDRMLHGVSNNAVVFQDPRYYFGRLQAPAAAHNGRKLDQIREKLTERGTDSVSGLYLKMAGAMLDFVVDEIDTSSIVNTSGVRTTLIVARSSKEAATGEISTDTELREYTDEVVCATQGLIRRRKSLEGAEFNSLNGTMPLVSLGGIEENDVDIDLLVKNIGELVEEPIHTLVSIPSDGLITELKG